MRNTVFAIGVSKHRQLGDEETTAFVAQQLMTILR
jgi:hypothetical protein